MIRGVYLTILIISENRDYGFFHARVAKIVSARIKTSIYLPSITFTVELELLYK